MTKAKRFLSLHQKIKGTLGKKSQPARVNKWKPPDHNGFKMNFNGAMFHDLAKASLGVVIRNQ